MSNVQEENYTCLVRENTLNGSFIIASDLSHKEASALIRKLRQEAKEQGTYYEDRYTLTFRKHY